MHKKGEGARTHTRMWRRVVERAAKASIRLATASTKGAARQLEGDCFEVAGGGTDPSTPMLVKPGEMKGASHRWEGAHVIGWLETTSI